MAIAYDMPPERAICIKQAAHFYHRPTDRLTVEGLEFLVHALARQEGGRNGEIVWNKPNKKGVRTYDIGLMQINSSNLPKLARLGVSEYQVRYNECVNIFVGTRILQEGLASTPDLWVGIGRYNSATPEINVKYQAAIWKQLNAMWSGR